MIFSLFICTGNFINKDCSAALSCFQTGYLGPPKSELARRPARSALRRQPGSPPPGHRRMSGYGTPSIGSRKLAQGRAYESAANPSILTRRIESLDPFMVEHEFRDRARDICVAHQR